MHRLRYLLAFASGVFFANAVPHLVNGTSGNPFPSPFADPPGLGDSAPFLNVLWAAFNVLVGYVLARWARIRSSDHGGLALLFLGALANALVASQTFGA